MATLAEDLTNEFEDDLPEVEPEDDGGEAQESEGDGEAEPEGDGDDAPEEVDVVGWGDAEIEAADEPEGVRNLRAALKREKERVKELEQRAAPKVDEVGPKPDYDDYFDKPEQFETDYAAWLERKRAVTEREEVQKVAARRQAEKWQSQSQALDDGYTELRAPAKDAARAIVEEQFAGEPFAFLVKAAGKNAPAFIYALGNSEERRAELNALKEEGSWAEFIAAAAVMAKEVNVQRRKPTTTPEKQHRGSTNGVGGKTDTVLARLEREADASGDRTALLEYRRKLRAREAARG